MLDVNYIRRENTLRLSQSSSTSAISTVKDQIWRYMLLSHHTYIIYAKFVAMCSNAIRTERMIDAILVVMTFATKL